MIENMGVNIITDSKLGRDFTLKELRSQGYEAVFLGIGAPVNMPMGIPGEEAEGVVQGIDFLKQYNIRGSVPVGKKLVIIGGGNAAVDAARTAIRLGAEEVTILYRRTQEQMPAYAEEIEEALLEGVKLKTLTQPIAIEKNGVGKVKGVTCACMQLGEFDRSGRRRPKQSDQQNFIVEADQVIIAIGQQIDSSQFAGEFDLHMGENRFIKTNPLTGQTSVDWIFSGGDAASGPVSVVSAIGEGEKAAVGIDQYLTGETHAFWREDKEVDTSYDPDAEPVPYPREKMPAIEIDRRKNNFEEVERSWCESVAIRQCERCLRCDYGKTPAKTESSV